MEALRQSGALYTVHPFIVRVSLLPPSQNTNALLPSADEYRNTEFQTLPLTIFTVLEVHADRSAFTSSPFNISGKQTTNSSFVSG